MYVEDLTLDGIAGVLKKSQQEVQEMYRSYVFQSRLSLFTVCFIYIFKCFDELRTLAIKTCIVQEKGVTNDGSGTGRSDDVSKEANANDTTAPPPKKAKNV